jgi:hypothetical protein
MRFPLLLLLALVIVAAIIVLLLRTKPDLGPRTNSIIHVPASGQCPSDFEKSAKFFTERDGSTKDACVSETGDGSIDVLMPGEGFSVHIPLPAPPPSASEGERRQL